MKRSKRLIDPPRDPREPPTDEPIPPEERARRMAELGRVLLQLARREGLLSEDEDQGGAE